MQSLAIFRKALFSERGVTDRQFNRAWAALSVTQSAPFQLVGQVLEGFGFNGSPVRELLKDTIFNVREDELGEMDRRRIAEAP